MAAALPSSFTTGRPMSDILTRNNVKIAGRGQQPMVFAHGYGCDQNMWRFITPAFEDRYKIVLFDHVGHGQSDAAAFDPAQYGALKREDIEGLLDFLDSNHLGWSSTMAPVIMGNPDRPALGEELTNSFCRTDPEIAGHFARTTFLSDNREDLQRVRTPSLVL